MLNSVAEICGPPALESLYVQGENTTPDAELHDATTMFQPNSHVAPGVLELLLLIIFMCDCYIFCIID